MTNDLSEIIQILKDKGHKRIRLLCNDTRDCEYASCFRDIAEVDFVYTSNVFFYFSLLSNADLVVSYRLHATLPSLSFGTPVINISYDERAERLLDDLGLGDWRILNLWRILKLRLELDGMKLKRFRTPLLKNSKN